MYYFELFELPVSLKTNPAAILKKYYQLSRQYHPDHFSMQDESEQQGALQMSARINEAKIILDDPYKRLAYILRENNIIEPDEKYQLSPMFLGEMMDINEQLMEMEFGDVDPGMKESLRQKIGEIKTSLYTDVKQYFEAAELQVSEADLLQLKDYYYKLKYVNRILEKLS